MSDRAKGERFTVTLRALPSDVPALKFVRADVERAKERLTTAKEKEAEAKGATRDAIYRGYAQGTSMRSFVRAEDVAAMAVFLGSDAARLVSGQIIAVDGHTENPDPKVP